MLNHVDDTHVIQQYKITIKRFHIPHIFLKMSLEDNTLIVPLTVIVDPVPPTHNVVDTDHQIHVQPQTHTQQEHQKDTPQQQHHQPTPHNIILPHHHDHITSASELIHRVEDLAEHAVGAALQGVKRVVGRATREESGGEGVKRDEHGNGEREGKEKGREGGGERRERSMELTDEDVLDIFLE